MQLPIDFNNRPFKEKYIDEETPMLARWMIFGEHSDGTVDVCTPETDIFQHVPREVAERLVEERNNWVASVVRELNNA